MFCLSIKIYQLVKIFKHVWSWYWSQAQTSNKGCVRKTSNIKIRNVTNASWIKIKCTGLVKGQINNYCTSGLGKQVAELGREREKNLFYLHHKSQFSLKRKTKNCLKQCKKCCQKKKCRK